VIAGGSLSITVTVKMQRLVLPLASVATQVTAVRPPQSAFLMEANIPKSPSRNYPRRPAKMKPPDRTGRQSYW